MRLKYEIKFDLYYKLHNNEKNFLTIPQETFVLSGSLKKLQNLGIFGPVSQAW